MANTLRALKLMASLGKLDSAVPKLPVSASSSESESSESEDEKVVYKRTYKKKTVPKSDALPVHPSAFMPASTFVPPAKQPLPPAPSAPPAPPAPKVPKVRKPRVSKKLKAPEAPVVQAPSQPEVKAPEPKIEPASPAAEVSAEPKKTRTKKIKKAPSAYNTFVGKMMKEGKSMKEASAAWKAQKN